VVLRERKGLDDKRFKDIILLFILNKSGERVCAKGKVRRRIEKIGKDCF